MQYPHHHKMFCKCFACNARKSQRANNINAEDCLASSLPPESCWNHFRMSSSGDCAWQAHSFQGLVENISECQALKTAWQGHSVQGLVKSPAKCQALKTAWQAHSPQGLVESPAKCQALKTAWQAHSFHGLVEIISECQALEICLASSLPPGSGWTYFRMSSSEDCLAGVTPCRVWLKAQPNVKLWRLLGKLTPLRVWLKAQPNVKLWRLLGKLTPFMVWSKLFPNVKLWRLCLASSLLPGSGWNHFRMSSSGDCLASSLLPGSGWNHFRMSSSGDCLASSSSLPRVSGSMHLQKQLKQYFWEDAVNTGRQ